MIHDIKLLEDANSRLQALELDSFIVEAPAGAGKTELLTQRFLKLLLQVQAPEEIIAITFTNKAASEMRARIMQSLSMAAASEAPTMPHKLATFELGQQVIKCSDAQGWHLLATPSRLRIYTIDSLSANLARQMPLLSRFGTQPAVRDDANIYYEEAATRALAHLDDANMGMVVQAALRYFDNDTYKLTQLLVEMLAKRDQWLPYNQTNNTALMAEEALAQMIAMEMAAAADALPARVQDMLMPVARYAASNLQNDNPISLLLDWEQPLTAKPEALGQWRALVELLLTGSGTLRKRLDKNIGLPSVDEAKPYKQILLEVIETLQQNLGAEQALARVQYLPNPQQDESTWQIIATLAQLLHIAVGELWLVFQAHGEVDFVEISQRSLQALQDVEGNTTDLALKLDYRIQHLLVDEFQDTSPTQIKLIHALTRGWQAGDGRTLFCVGDPMQSIYRFRKANVGLFLRVAQHGIGDIQLTPLKLWRNNRSCPPVIDWVNHAFAQVFPQKDSIAHGAIQYRPFVATKPDEAFAGVTVHAMLDTQSPADNSLDPAPDENEDDEPLLPSDMRQYEADRIIEIIQATRQTKPNANIAVLVRARSHLEGLVTAIRRNHPSLSFQAVEIEELADRQIVQDLLSLTFALHQRADRVHWLAMLRAPWCGLTLADLHALIGQDKHSTLLQLMHNDTRLQSLSADGQTRLLHLRDVVTQALSHQGRMSVSRWLHGVWLMLGGASCLWDAGDVRDVQAFFERVQQLENTGSFSPEQLAVEVKKLYAAPDAKAPDTLQLMTIHKSKGLEFDTVILPGLDRKTGGSHQPLLLWEEVSADDASHDSEEMRLVVAPLAPKQTKSKTKTVTPYDYLNMLEKERAQFEDARVLYVAATRAERYLHLLGIAKLDAKSGLPKPPKNTFLEMLWPIVHTQFSPEHALQPQSQASQTNAVSLSNFVPQLVRLNLPCIPNVLATKHIAQLMEGSQSTTKDSNTFDADVGTLTHIYLQLIAEDSLAKWDDARLDSLTLAMQRWFKQNGHSSAQATLGAERVRHLLKNTLLSEQGRWVLQARTNAASELALEAQLAEGVSKKIIDRTFVENGVRWIIDYKTIALDEASTESTLMQISEQYRDQIEGYANLFADEGLPIQKAIFYVAIGRMVLMS